MDYNQTQIKEKFQRLNKLSAEEKALDEKPTAEDILNNISHSEYIERSYGI